MLNYFYIPCFNVLCNNKLKVKKKHTKSFGIKFGWNFERFPYFISMLLKITETRFDSEPICYFWINILFQVCVPHVHVNTLNYLLKRHLLPSYEYLVYRCWYQSLYSMLPSITRLYSAAASPSERLRSDGSLAITESSIALLLCSKGIFWRYLNLLLTNCTLSMIPRPRTEALKGQSTQYGLTPECAYC